MSGRGPPDLPDNRDTPKTLACEINKSGHRNRFLTLKINVFSCPFRYNQVHRIKSGDAKRGKQNIEGISNKTQHKTQYTQQNKNITEPFLTCQALFLNPGPLEDRKGPLPTTLLCWTFTGINMLYIVIII